MATAAETHAQNEARQPHGTWAHGDLRWGCIPRTAVGTERCWALVRPSYSCLAYAIQKPCPRGPQRDGVVESIIGCGTALQFQVPELLI
jgi:hypothetical protein